VGVRLYRKRPVTIEAIEFTRESLVEVIDFLRAGKVHYLIKVKEFCSALPTGDMLALHGDFIIRGLMGEYYPCKPAAFEANYSPLGGQG
jgi:hypothetical protein